ncbi:MAG: methyltransferase domain-containing protein [Candidatus Hermodarchaeota archaeon]
MPTLKQQLGDSEAKELSKTIKDAYDAERKHLPKDRSIYGQSSFYFTYHIAIELLKQKLVPRRKILDIGCSGGLIRRFLQSEGVDLEYYGLDLILEALIANKKYHSDVKLFNSSATELPFQDETFEYIISCETLEHIPDTVTTLKEIFRVLKPQGRVVLSVPNYGNPILAAIAKFFHVFLGNPHFAMGEQVFEHHFTVEYLDDLFQKLSFRIIDSIGAHYVPNKDALVWVSEVIPFFRRIVKWQYFYSNTRFKTHRGFKRFATNIFYLLEKP